ncbi:MAG TPA: signal peptidase II [Acidimicrobiales bacterium]|nr:signal peptidase II [Acidimicrobiales bacterium]
MAGAVVLGDQATKAWALAALDGGATVDVVGSLRFRLVFNRGIAFGLGSRFAPLIALLAVAVVAFLARSGGALQRPGARASLGLVLGGAVGNLLDRLLRPGGGVLGGAVVDFVDLQWWPVFNLADAAITVGAVLLALTARDDPGLGGGSPSAAEASTARHRAPGGPDASPR